LTNPALVHVLRRLVGFYLHRADHIVAIGERMRERLIEKGTPPERITVIPNWVDASAITPGPRDTAWAREQGLSGRFVVMHSGNVGHAQNLDNLVRATTFLRDLDDLVVPIVGFGARHVEVKELANSLEADKVSLLPYQPREVLAQSLGSADIHYIGLAKGLSGFVVPSRLYGVLAAGRPVIVAADPDSETARLVSEIGCGVAVPADRPDLIAAAIRDAHDGRFDLDGMGRRGREYVEREADRPIALARYRSLIDSVMNA
jgi:colanic acid biosynthesis glycosyl transferase WcaI